MQSIHIVALGKIKEPYLQAGLAEYVKRLGPLCKLHITELADEKPPANPTAADIERLKEVEGQRLLQALATEDYFIALDMRGQALSSEGLAAHLAQLALSGHSRLAFGIGASNGLSEAVLSRANFRLSFGPMTYPHQLMRLILIEQVYRAHKIIRNEPYHK